MVKEIYFYANVRIAGAVYDPNNNRRNNQYQANTISLDYIDVLQRSVVREVFCNLYFTIACNAFNLYQRPHGQLTMAEER